MKREFSDYEIECIIADLELNLSLPHSKELAKGSLKAILRKRKEQKRV
ncbi:MAG: hypothetical protein N0A00_10130 [Candidatus Bathyarchaeota archaeon]|nr:hypothetical protein [Candidatus Bathyarchaeota archaeon]